MLWLNKRVVWDNCRVDLSSIESFFFRSYGLILPRLNSPIFSSTIPVRILRLNSSSFSVGYRYLGPFEFEAALFRALY